MCCAVYCNGKRELGPNAEPRKCGSDLGDNTAFLLGLRFADGIPLFARTAAQTMALLDPDTQIKKMWGSN